jgi:hypothetical protein
MLECLVPPGNTTSLSPHKYPQINGIDSWLLGAHFTHAPAEPIRLEWNPDTDGTKKHLYGATVPLMHKQLLRAVQLLGIDNLDCYSVEIADSVTGEVDRDYVAFNLLGAVQAADLSQSKYADPSGLRRIDMDFDSLSISPAAARGALMFRLAECVSGLVVHECIKRGLEAKGGFGLSFVPPDEWIG